MIYGNTIGGAGGSAETFVLVDEKGNEAVAVLVDEKTIFNATANDIREGKTAATESGVTLGTKVIPSYHTTEGYRFITTGSEFETLPMGDLNLYDFTKLQAIICPFNEAVDTSVAAEKVAVNDGVYPVGSTELLATVVKNSETKRINFGITNESEKLYLLRYFTYKEIY